MAVLFDELSAMALGLLWAIMYFVCFSSIGATRSGCANPLGLENKKIENSQLSSYSHYDGWDPFRARLNNDKAWCSNSNDHFHEYLQIDLLTVRHVSAITTQGVKSGTFPLYASYYVKTYMIKYSYDGRTWFFYEDTNGADRTFTGNKDANGEHTNYFRETFVTRFLRIFPKMFNRDMCLRVELYGCNQDDCSNLLTAPTGSITSVGFPDSYPADRDCTWLISVSGNKKIALMFTQFDVYQGSIPQSCSDDFLEVRNGLTDISSQIGEEYCNNNRAMLMTSRQNVVRIYFHSGGTSHAHKGFQIHYLAVTQGSEDVFAVEACDGSALTLNCSVYDNTINILHAWYHLGYSPNSCGRPDSSLSPVCSAFDAKNIITSKCQDYRECHISVNESLFGHSCPGVTLQLEVFYQCTSTNLKTPPPTSTAPLPTSQRTSTNAATSVPPITTNTQPSHSFTDTTKELPTTENSSIEPTVSFVTTTPSQIGSSVGTNIAKPTLGASSGTAAPPVGGKEARSGGGMATGIAVGIIVVVIAVLIAALLTALFLFRKKRERKQKGECLKTPTVKFSAEREYCAPENSDRRRCPLDYSTSGSRNAYQTVNILYQSANGSNDTENTRIEDDHAYASCPVDNLPKITENPLYDKGVSPPFDSRKDAEKGYELVKPPPREYDSPSDTPPLKMKSINNPNYEQTLPLEQSDHECSVPEASKC